MSRTPSRLPLTIESAHECENQRSHTMKFILMMNTMKADAAAFNGWSKDDIKAHIGFMISLNKELRAAGELVSAEGLAFPNEAKLIRADDKGQPITDGVFP